MTKKNQTGVYRRSNMNVIKMVLLAGIVLSTGCANQGVLKKSKLYSVTAEIMVLSGVIA